MTLGNDSSDKVYRLVVEGDGGGVACEIEFPADGPHAIIAMAQKVCADQRANMFENGRLLGSLEGAGQGRFWLIPPASEARPR